MIVPRNRLLFWVAAVVLPFSALGPAVPALALPSAAVIACFFLLVLADAAFSLKRAVGIELEFPELVRLSTDRRGTIGMVLKNPDGKGGRPMRLRVGLPFPPEITPDREDILLEAGEGGEELHFEWPCVASRRGRFFFNTCRVEHASRLAFWDVRRSVPAVFEVRVYPNLRRDVRDLAAFLLNRASLGMHAQRQIGQGREFEKLREYVPGDSYDSIHWKMTAKRGRPITKVFQIERSQEVYLVVDSSRLSARPVFTGTKAEADTPADATPSNVLERFITMSLAMFVSASRQGDRFGLLTFSDVIHGFVKAGSGRAHYNSCREALFSLVPRMVTPDLDGLCSFISTKLRKRALLLFLTSLDDPTLAETLVKNMGQLGRKHLVLINMIRPPGAGPVFSTPDVENINDIYARLGGHFVWHDLEELRKVMGKQGVKFSVLEGEKAASGLLEQYLSVKRRQLL